MTDSTYESTDSIYGYVLAELEARKGQWPDLARQTGISRRTIEKIARREVKDPGVSLIERLASHFREEERQGRRALAS